MKMTELEIMMKEFRELDPCEWLASMLSRRAGVEVVVVYDTENLAYRIKVPSVKKGIVLTDDFFLDRRPRNPKEAVRKTELIVARIKEMVNYGG